MRFVKTFAIIVGSILSPVSWVMYMVAYLLFEAKELFSGSRSLEVMSFFLLLVVPFTVFIAFMQLRIIEDPDTRDRKKRILILLMFLFCDLLLIGVSLFGGQYNLAKFMLLLIAPGALVALVNKFWLLSIHTSTNAVMVTIMAYFSGWPYSLLFVLVLLVGWSRVYEKKHTVSQVIIGALVGIVITFGILRFFFQPGQFSQ
ncbi:phosphatase PAP2 family protein [Candidatus Dojkabacteria bacterium]|nr:phosphatase PAP2 family protein [Candidatus Dojkabacteria bacterium]